LPPVTGRLACKRTDARALALDVRGGIGTCGLGGHRADSGRFCPCTRACDVARLDLTGQAAEMPGRAALRRGRGRARRRRGPMSEGARELLVRGVTAARANSEEEARFHLEWVLRTDADLEQKTEAWYWLSRLARDPAERRACLENVLAGCPGHPEARRDLAILDGRLDPAEIVDHRQPVAPLTPHAELGPQDVRGYRCPRCGGALRFDAGKRAVWCQFCGYREGAGPGPPGAGAPGQAVEEQDWVAAIYTARGHRWEVPTERLFACQGCGATQVVPPGQASATCPFCGSPYVVRAAEERELIQPEGVAPFAFDG